MPKQYINGVFIKEAQTKFGPILKLSIPADKINMLTEQLKAAVSDGWTKLEITKLREPKTSKTSGKVTSTHSLSVDDWKPSGQGGQATNRPTPPANSGPQSDDVPF